MFYVFAAPSSSFSIGFLFTPMQITYQESHLLEDLLKGFLHLVPDVLLLGQAGEDEAKGDGEVVELEAYRQGTQKTELCNKWEGGACSYGGRCRFAHGLQEMRPVIRHPRYK
ncbi:putative zinc finger CCCH domain-containing protein 21, partial [Triticum aestivum]|uniref:putative zinc finger CCCH domain-containing protein 21 n=1 Tax=Triticum aestivum TaxID=4565 RepID=UPI001D01CAE5